MVFLAWSVSCFERLEILEKHTLEAEEDLAMETAETLET